MWIIWKCLPMKSILLQMYIYRPQRSWGKVIFSQASVILFTGGYLLPGVSGPWGVPAPRGCLVPGGVRSQVGVWSWGCLVLGGCLFPGGLVLGGVWSWRQGVPGPKGSGPGRCLVLEAGGVWSKGVPAPGVSGPRGPAGDPPPPEGSTHPTGMHSCYHDVLN